MNKREVGSRYEEVAAAYLADMGYTVLEKNYRCKQGEIDIIASLQGYLIFIEVKYRKNLKSGSPLEAVGPSKQNRIRQAARYYLYSHGYGEDQPCRFDVIGILGSQIILIQNAF